MMPRCHTCGYEFESGESGWVEDWKVLDVTCDGFRHETRYYCDDCEAKQ